MRQRRSEQMPLRSSGKFESSRLGGWRNQVHTATEERDVLYDIADTLPERMGKRMKLLAEDIYDQRLKTQAKPVLKPVLPAELTTE